MLVLVLDYFFVRFVLIPNFFSDCRLSGCSSTYSATAAGMHHLSLEATGKVTWPR